MEIRVHGKHMTVGQDLRELTERKVGHAGRIFGDGSVADVEFSQHQNPRVVDDRYRVEITVPVAGQVVRVEAAAHDERAALDVASDKLENVLRRLKERLIGRSRRASHKTVVNGALDDDDEADDEPSIVRVKQFAIKPMLPAEAALQMDMLEHNFFFFLNGETDRYSVLYRRRDGNLGLIEAE